MSVYSVLNEPVRLIRTIQGGDPIDILISNSSGKPIYEQICQQIKTQIMDGTLTAGEALPSMRVLAKELHLSVITVQRAYEDLNAMLEACREAGLRPKICSAYRTQSKQTYLYNNKIARLRNAGYSRAAAEAEAGRWVARPGTSEHQLGLALDIVSQSYQALTKKQEKTAEQKWLLEHCWEYGFILRYPNDKSEITGIGYEPWHYRYVGREVALDIRDSGLCMEEYLLLREETLEKQA